MTKYDFIVLGSGPAGKRAAIQAAKLGKSVLVIDDRSRVGGVSVHTGTIPSKTIRETVLNLSGWRERSFYGASYRVKREINDVDLTSRLSKTLEHEIAILEHQFVRNGVQIIHGTARFIDDYSVSVESSVGGNSAIQYATADKFLIAVGTRPYRPENIPFNGTSVIDSDEFIKAPSVPRRLAVVGAGVIGLEYATIFSALDVAVTIIEPRTDLLDFLDREIVDNLVYQLRERGIGLRLGVPVSKVDFDKNNLPICILDDGRKVRSDVVLFAAGRLGATDQLNLDACGLEPDTRGRIVVNPDTFQTQQPHIYAAGDVIGFPSLASISMEQGRAAALHAFGKCKTTDDQHYPLGIYSVPEISAVGLSEAEVIKRGLPYECGIARLSETSRGHIMGLNSGILKLIFDAKSMRLLGAHIVGEGASELIHIGQAVINLGGTLDYFMNNSFNYPTLAEAYKIAALDAWNRMSD